MNYLLDGRCEISNNHAERKAKSYAIGRKAFLFHTSEAGAGASAVMYSICLLYTSMLNSMQMNMPMQGLHSQQNNFVCFTSG